MLLPSMHQPPVRTRVRPEPSIYLARLYADAPARARFLELAARSFEHERRHEHPGSPRQKVAGSQPGGRVPVMVP